MSTFCIADWICDDYHIAIFIRNLYALICPKKQKNGERVFDRLTEHADNLPVIKAEVEQNPNITILTVKKACSV